MLRIGLTGGIGSGKSTVCRLFSELGTPIIDTDKIAHALVAPGQPALALLSKAFGEELLDQQGRLDRAALRKRIFHDDTDRQRLEALLHPLIRAEMQRQLKMLRTKYVIIAIPLLLEKGWQDEVDRILVIDTDEGLQVERTARRDGISEEQVRRIMLSQVSRQQRLASADDVIHNEGDLDALRAQIKHLHHYYLQLAHAFNH